MDQLYPSKPTAFSPLDAAGECGKPLIPMFGEMEGDENCGFTDYGWDVRPSPWGAHALRWLTLWVPWRQALSMTYCFGLRAACPMKSKLALVFDHAPPSEMTYLPGGDSFDAESSARMQVAARQPLL